MQFLKGMTWGLAIVIPFWAGIIWLTVQASR